MTNILSVYAINGLSFALNIAAVFLIRSYAGAAGYGVFGIYLVFTSVFLLLDISIVKSAILRLDEHSDVPADQIGGYIASALPWLLPLLVALALGGDWLYPVDPETSVGGSFVATLLVVEYVLSYPANALVYRWTIAGQYNRVFLLRLGGTALKVLLIWLLLVWGFSIDAALLAVLAKGVLFLVLAFTLAPAGAFSIRPRLGKATASESFRIYQIFGSLLMLLVMQEAYGVYIDRTYGRAALGDYRTIYDVVNGIWFLASVYPTILFPYLKTVSRRGFEDTESLKTLAIVLALLHAGYGLFLIFLFGIDPFDLGVIDAASAYAVGLFVGVAVLGYNRFLIEIGHAMGASARVLGAISVGTLLSVGLLAAAQGTVPKAEIGIAWAVSQLVLTAVLMAVIFFGSGRRAHFASAAAVMVVFASYAGLSESVFDAFALAVAALVGAMVAGVALIEVFWSGRLRLMHKR